jgi:hypothetical protein
MKKLGFFLVIFFILGLACFAQTNDAQRIVGTWQRIDDGTPVVFTFNANGTVVRTFKYSVRGGTRTDESTNGNYFIVGSKLIYTYNSNTATVVDFYISTNGKILVFGERWYQKQ